MTPQHKQKLIEHARAARERAYAPYSKFHVGAALEMEGGEIVAGCNVENLSFGLTICAERNAVFAALAMGQRQFRRIVIVADSKLPVSPCGACRQVLAEFNPTLDVLCVNLDGKEYAASLDVLLPRACEGILDRESST